MNYERHDAMLMEILREKKTVLGFLQSVFGFLSRSTDFYHEMKNEQDNFGFPPGFKEQLVFKVIKQFDKQSLDLKKQTSPAPTEVVAEEIVESESASQSNTKELQEKIERSSISSKHKLESNIFQSNEYFNGAAFKNYCWGQTISDIELHISLPDNIISSKQLNVQIETDFIKISYKNENRIILEGKLFAKCKHLDAVWSILNKKLQINLDKIKEIWWKKFLENEAQIDLSKMDCSRPMNELPEDQQAVIEKLQWDQQQKMLGLPTSEEIRNREILKQAWDAEGSPFKGQPFDPSAVKFN